MRRTPLFGLALHHLDAHLVVVEKPPGVRMHPGHPRPQASLKEMLRRELWDHPGAPASVVHRLDAGTSGLVVLGLDPAATGALSGQFEARRVEKRYRAIVRGHVAADAGVIDLPIGPVSGRPGGREQGVGGRAARPARTRFAVVARRGGRTLLDLVPETGRRHQLRVHLAALGHPVWGDALYGRERGGEAAAPQPGRHALHAAELAFVHPETGERLRFRAPLPADLETLWAGAGPAPRPAAALA